jgi:hypothetical protein
MLYYGGDGGHTPPYRHTMVEEDIEGRVHLKGRVHLEGRDRINPPGYPIRTPLLRPHTSPFAAVFDTSHSMYPARIVAAYEDPAAEATATHALSLALSPLRFHPSNEACSCQRSPCFD